jgi:hypothetical protein
MPEFETINTTSAAEFLSLLRRSNPYWLNEDGWTSNWIFRGQYDANWPLVPAAWRVRDGHPLFQGCAREVNDEHIDSIIGRYPGSDRERARRVAAQAWFESRSVSHFASMVDELGFPVPGHDTPMCERIRDAFEQSEFGNIHPVAALARHHGAAVRLLDWTYNPIVAAFFATTKSDTDKQSEKIAVWAVNRRYMSVHGTCTWFTAPRSQIGFLRAQEGLFTHIRNAGGFYLEHGRWPAFEEKLHWDGIRKVTLPAEHVPQLQKMLWLERVSCAHLMPTHDNITKALQENWAQAYVFEAEEAKGNPIKESS